jgi:murein DD-endopeptidase MepM/ murein hydrolase activator NlpD
MNFQARYAGFLLFFGLSALIGWQGYTYIFDTEAASITLTGIEDEGWCAGDAACTITSNKKGDVSIALDGQPLINEFKMGKSHVHPFSIPTKQIASGAHKLKIVFVDRSYNKNKTEIEREFFVDNQPLQAALVRPDANAKVFQGRTLHVQFQVNKPIKGATVSTLSEKYPCFPESKKALIYEAYVPVPCEEKANEYLFSVDVVDNVGNTVRLDNKFQVVAYPFKKNALALSKETVDQEHELGAEAQVFENLISKLTEESPQEKLWNGSFCTPVDIKKITTEFGTIRTTQHKGRYAHKAIDVIDAPRSVVWATQDGVVVLKDRFEHSGNTIVIDHGFGLLSMFFHLEDFARINVGDKVAIGNPIGTLGKTGYATGYHLHWEMRVNNIPVDPMQWTKEIF